LAELGEDGALAAQNAKLDRRLLGELAAFRQDAEYEAGTGRLDSQLHGAQREAVSQVSGETDREWQRLAVDAVERESPAFGLGVGGQIGSG